MALTHLDYDSELFGFRVGRITSASDRESLSSDLEKARAEGYKVLYWSTVPEQAEMGKELGGRLADLRRTYARDITTMGHFELAANWFICAWNAEEDVPERLFELAEIAGHESRFNDPGFGKDGLRKLYRDWVRRSANRESAEELLYVEDFGTSRSRLTIELKEGRPQIGLVATRSEDAGRGMAGDLVRSAVVWSINRGYKELAVVTQSANESANRFYRKLGFEVEREEAVFHFWL